MNTKGVYKDWDPIIGDLEIDDGPTSILLYDPRCHSGVACGYKFTVVEIGEDDTVFSPKFEITLPISC